MITTVVRNQARPAGALEAFPSFTKTIAHQNQHHDRARSVCELCIPRPFATENQIVPNKTLMFVTRTLVEDHNANSRRNTFMRMRFRTVDRNNGNFVIRHGWREFSQFHDIKINWRLQFVLTGPNQMYVQRLKRINRTGERSRPVRL